MVREEGGLAPSPPPACLGSPIRASSAPTMPHTPQTTSFDVGIWTDPRIYEDRSIFLHRTSPTSRALSPKHCTQRANRSRFEQVGRHPGRTTGPTSRPHRAPSDVTSAPHQSAKSPTPAGLFGDKRDFHFHGGIERKNRHTHGGASVRTRLSKDLSQQFRGPVDNPRLTSEFGRRRHKPGHM